MKKKKIVIGLTGGLGSGKSTVLRELKRLGSVTADADALVHGFLAPGGAAYKRVVRLFGPGVVGPEGMLDRRAMAARVFVDPSLRKALEFILHPLVRRELRRTAARTKRGVVVLDIPLLYESKLARTVDRVCVVWAPDAARISRLKKDGRFTPADVRRRIKAQMPLARKRRLADDVIDNGGTAAGTRARVRALWRAWNAAI